MDTPRLRAKAFWGFLKLDNNVRALAECVLKMHLVSVRHDTEAHHNVISDRVPAQIRAVTGVGCGAISITGKEEEHVSACVHVPEKGVVVEDHASLGRR